FVGTTSPAGVGSTSSNSTEFCRPLDMTLIDFVERLDAGCGTSTLPSEQSALPELGPRRVARAPKSRSVRCPCRRSRLFGARVLSPREERRAAVLARDTHSR